MSLGQKADTYMKMPDNTNEVIFKAGMTEDNIKVILYADRFAAKDTERFAKFFDTGNQYADLNRLWDFVRNKIRYVADPAGKEMIQLPSRLWKSKKGDCKSKSLFIASILKNLGIPYVYRFSAYKDAGVNGIGRLGDDISRMFSVPSTPVDVSHVYVIANPGTDEEVIIDAVYDRFDSEHPFDYAIDYNPDYQTFHRIGKIGSEVNASTFLSGLLKIAAGIAGIYFINQYLSNAESD